ncbi:MAG: hypothetical protein ACEQR8_02940 [Cypionkella sp.]
MTLFESIFAIISVVTSLALTHLIAGVVKLIRHAERSRWSFTHGCWMWLAFVLVIGNWASLIGVQGNAHWPPDRIILWLTAMISLYIFTALVVPETQPGEPIDLRTFEQDESRRYIVAHNVFAACALLLIFGVRGVDLATVKLAAFPLAALVLGLIAMVAGPRWLRAAIAVVLAVNGSVMTFGLLAALDR